MSRSLMIDSIPHQYSHYYSEHWKILRQLELGRACRSWKSEKVVLSCTHKILSIHLKYFFFNLIFSSTQVKWLPFKKGQHLNPMTIVYFYRMNLVICPCTLNHNSFALLVSRDLNTSWIENCISETSARKSGHELQKFSHCQSSKYSIKIFTYCKLLCYEM